MRLGDLDALRKAVNDFYDSHFKGLVPKELITYAEAVDDLIDNAPTVTNGTYEQGFRVGAYGRLDEIRPQGEWENDSDNLPICNKCGEIALQRIFVKMPHLIQDVRMVRSNFCPNCGTDMRGE